MKKIRCSLVFATVLGMSACGGGEDQQSTTATVKDVQNEMPVAVIQSTQDSAMVGDSILLDGSESTDDGATTLSYRWAVVKKPENSFPSLGASTDKTFHFIPDRTGDYELSLVVNDGQQDSQTTTVKLQVFARNTEQVVNPSDVILDSENDDVLVDNTEEKGKVIFRDGFETGTIRVDKYSNDPLTWNAMALHFENRSSATIVKDPAGTGQNVAKFVVPDDGQCYRAEIQRKQFGWGHYNYSFSHYIPSTWPTFQYGTILAQWHGFNLNGKDLNPPIALVLSGLKPEWQLHLYELKPMSSPLAVPETLLKRYVLDVPVAYNQWNDWNFDIQWSELDANNQLIPGKVVVKHNGKEVANISGVNNYHQKWSPYFQMGIYRSSWREGALKNRVIVGQPVEAYHKNVVIKDLN